jgi:(p)ppGpp synthase/HD superfamily hydrolase
MICAAFLHDAIEDQGVTGDEIAALFGRDVAGLVLEVTTTSPCRRQSARRSRSSMRPPSAQAPS